jgi:radical SAM protein with 4Fe4S-binding SPASM domain
VIVRYESWGGWAKLEGDLPAVVALDREGMRALGLDGGASWHDGPAQPSAPLEVHVAVTSRCAAGCEGCYLDARADGEHVPFDDVLRTLDALAASGVFTVAFGGGEPTTRDDLGDIAKAARARGITPVVTTSGLGLSPAKIDALHAFAQVNVSYDGVGEDYERVRGFDGGHLAERAISELARRGIRTGVNVVLTQGTWAALPDTLSRAKALGACEAQLLRYKPQGRAKSLDYLSRRLTPEQGASLGPVLRTLWQTLADERFSLRIDCALVPFLSADPSIDPARLQRFGIFGCEAAGALAAVRTDGKIAPCSFAEPTETHGVDIARHRRDPELARWRQYAAIPPEPCASCAIASVCKGGCKIVSMHTAGTPHAPDPECPRVRARRHVSGSARAWSEPDR